MTKNQFTGTAMKPHRNRKIRHFNNDQYYTYEYYHTRVEQLIQDDTFWSTMSQHCADDVTHLEKIRQYCNRLLNLDEIVCHSYYNTSNQDNKSKLFIVKFAKTNKIFRTQTPIQLQGYVCNKTQTLNKLHNNIHPAAFVYKWNTFCY